MISSQCGIHCFIFGSKKREYLYKYAYGFKQTVEKYPMIKGYLKTSLLEACGQDLEMKNEIEKVL